MNDDADLVQDIRAFARFSQEERRMLLQVGDSLRAVEFGNLIIVVHQGHVIQIELEERFRL